MIKKILVGLIGLVIAVAGVAAFSAFTAQLVNLEAHVEKEIEVAPVVCQSQDGQLVCTEDPTGGNYGVVVPQELYDKIIEVTLSDSFFDQQDWFDVTFDVLWECKQYDPPRDANGDTLPDCRPVEDPSQHDPSHPNQELDGRLRDYVHSIITDSARCLEAAQGPNPSNTPEVKDVELVGSGVLDITNPKCFYTIKLQAPPCSDSFNPATDPLGPDVDTIDCHFIKPSPDPQTWEHFADIGDDFKIQVTGHSRPPGG